MPMAKIKLFNNRIWVLILFGLAEAGFTTNIGDFAVSTVRSQSGVTARSAMRRQGAYY